VITDNIRFRKVSVNDLPIKIFIYPIEAFPGRDAPLWSTHVDGPPDSFQMVEVPVFDRPVRIVTAYLGSGRVKVYPPLPPHMRADLNEEGPAPFIFAGMPEASFPLTVALYSTADRDRRSPLWTRTYPTRGQLIAVPPLRDYWPCVVKCTYGNGATFEVDMTGMP